MYITPSKGTNELAERAIISSILALDPIGITRLLYDINTTLLYHKIAIEKLYIVSTSPYLNGDRSRVEVQIQQHKAQKSQLEGSFITQAARDHYDSNGLDLADLERDGLTKMAVEIMFADKTFYRDPYYLQPTQPYILQTTAQTANNLLAEYGYTGAFVQSGNDLNIAFYSHQNYFLTDTSES
ncbi:hypothetical protein GW755_03620 [bacterium]|nr:hypothetical protein [bacterium]